MRKGFNFYKSYYDIYEMLDKNIDKVAFIDAIFNKQFYGIDPDLEKLSPMVKMAYIGQKHSLDKSVKGYEDKTNTTLQPPLERTLEQPLERSFKQVQEKEQEQEQEQEQEKEKLKKEKRDLVFPFDSLGFRNMWELWKEYKSTEHKFKYKSIISEQAALQKLSGLTNNEQTAIAILKEAMSNGYKGFFKLNTNNNGQSTNQSTAEYFASGQADDVAY